jgi:hypothetical protein
MKPIADLQFTDLFKIDDSHDDGILDSYDWSNGDASTVLHATGTFLEKAVGDALGKGVAGVSDFSWDAPMTAAFAKSSVSEPFSNPLSFSKSSVGYKLGVTRIEEKQIDGEKWAYAYSGDELVDAHLIRG